MYGHGPSLELRDQVLLSPRGAFTVPPLIRKAAWEFLNQARNDDLVDAGSVDILEASNSEQKLFAMFLEWMLGIATIRDCLKSAGTVDEGALDTLSGVVTLICADEALRRASTTQGSELLSKATVSDPSPSFWVNHEGG